MQPVQEGDLRLVLQGGGLDFDFVGLEPESVGGEAEGLQEFDGAAVEAAAGGVGVGDVFRELAALDALPRAEIIWPSGWHKNEANKSGRIMRWR